jgi:hypothetical protein
MLGHRHRERRRFASDEPVSDAYRVGLCPVTSSRGHGEDYKVIVGKGPAGEPAHTRIAQLDITLITVR